MNITRIIDKSHCTSNSICSAELPDIRVNAFFGFATGQATAFEFFSKTNQVASFQSVKHVWTSVTALIQSAHELVNFSQLLRTGSVSHA